MEKTNPRAAFSYHSKPISHSPGKKCQWMEKKTIKKLSIKVQASLLLYVLHLMQNILLIKLRSKHIKFMS